MSYYDKTFTLKIKFVDGEIIKLRGVGGYANDEDVYTVDKNGYRQFFNKTQIKYIGREFDLEEDNNE